jgi:hypothetical protein
VLYIYYSWSLNILFLCTASDKDYQLLSHGRLFSPGTPASSTTKTGHHDITEILLKVALNTIIQFMFVFRLLQVILGDFIVWCLDVFTIVVLIIVCAFVLASKGYLRDTYREDGLLLKSIPLRDHCNSSPLHLSIKLTQCMYWTFILSSIWNKNTIPEHLSLPPVFSEVRVTRSLVLCVCFVDRCLSFFFWPLCCRFFFNLRILITYLISSNCVSVVVDMHSLVSMIFFVK